MAWRHTTLKHAGPHFASPPCLPCSEVDWAKVYVWGIDAWGPLPSPPPPSPLPPKPSPPPPRPPSPPPSSPPSPRPHAPRPPLPPPPSPKVYAPGEWNPFAGEDEGHVGLQAGGGMKATESAACRAAPCLPLPRTRAPRSSSPHCTGAATNFAYGKPVTVSTPSQQDAYRISDGNDNTAWQSGAGGRGTGRACRGGGAAQACRPGATPFLALALPLPAPSPHCHRNLPFSPSAHPQTRAGRWATLQGMT